MSQRLLTIAQVADKVAFSVGWVRGQIRAGAFPKPVHIGWQSRWVESEVDAWIAERAEQPRRSQGLRRSA